MPKQVIKRTITLTSGGGTTSIATDDLYDAYIIETSGSVTLSSDVVFESSGDLYDGILYEFEYHADINADGNTITFFGTAMPDHLTDKSCKITCYYNDSTWKVKFFPDIAGTGIIGTTQFKTTPYAMLDYTTGVNSTATLTEEVLGSVQVSSDVFSQVGDTIVIVGFGRTKANADTKTIKLRSNDTNVINPAQTYIYNSVTTAPNGKEFYIKATITRRNAVTAWQTGEIVFDQVAPEITVVNSGAAYTFTADPAQTLTFSITSTLGTATADDVELDAMYVYKITQA